MRTLRKCARPALIMLSALLLNLYGALWTSTAYAATVVAQGQVNNGPLAAPFVFTLLLALIFVVVLGFSFIAYRDASSNTPTTTQRSTTRTDR